MKNQLIAMYSINTLSWQMGTSDSKFSPHPPPSFSRRCGEKGEEKGLEPWFFGVVIRRSIN